MDMRRGFDHVPTASHSAPHALVAAKTPAAAAVPEATKGELLRLKRDELVKMCQRAGTPITGSKDVLITRLLNPSAHQKGKRAAGESSGGGSAKRARSKSGAEAAFEMAVASIEVDGYAMIFTDRFERPWNDADDPSQICRASLMRKPHLLLPTAVGAPALQMWAALSSLSGRERWEQQLLPAAAAALAHATNGQAHLALAPLIGILLWGDEERSSNSQEWLTWQASDADAPSNWPSFVGFFADVSTAWQIAFTHTDAALGIAPGCGLGGGYRSELYELLSRWEDWTNAIATQTFDDDVRLRPKARLKLGPWAASKWYDDEVEQMDAA